MIKPIPLIALASALLLSLALIFCSQAAVTIAAPRSVKWGAEFNSHWQDGQAEIAAYDLSIKRYDEVRSGSAVTIFVTEDFSNSSQTKADHGKHPASDVFSVMKLNLVQDFPTGIYDYNLMTSSFVALSERGSRPAGSLAKVSFSCQEWCGHVYQELFFGQDKVSQQKHSYFDGENAPASELKSNSKGLSEDSLLHWARGMAGPELSSGQSLRVPFLPSLQSARLNHKALSWTTAELSVAAASEKLQVPAGEFEVIKRTAKVADGTLMSYWVEKAFPHQVIRWSSSKGVDAQLIGSKRMKYWGLHSNGHEAILKDIGLKSRSKRQT
mgnify:CR=1 FL=1